MGLQRLRLGGGLNATGETLEVGDALLVVEKFGLVGAEHRITGEKGSGQRRVAPQLRIPPAMGNADMALLH